jgi:hypothetical protein
MKCPNCNQENKDKAKTCRKCDREMSLPPAWFPDARWHLKVLGTIYVCVVIFYYSVSFLLRKLPKPYDIRNIPIEITPWLRQGPKYLEEDQLTPPGGSAPAAVAPFLAPPLRPLPHP